MQTIPVHFFFGDEDETLIHVIPERKLYLAVFQTALADLVGGKGIRRQDALAWFKNEYETAPIKITEIISMFKFTESRMKLLREYIADETNFCKGRSTKFFNIRRRTDNKKVPGPKKKLDL